MRFLVDAQFPRRLVDTLNDHGHDAIHTLDLADRNASTDREIARVADAEDRIVATKDKDFRDSHLLRGTPRQLLIVTTGNIRNADLMSLIVRALPSMRDAFAEAHLVELSADGLILHHRRPKD